jgi:hypothetical protein
MEIEITATIPVVEIVDVDSIDQAVQNFMLAHDGQLPDTVEGRHVLGLCGKCTATILDGDIYYSGYDVWACETCAETEAAQAEKLEESSTPSGTVEFDTGPVDIIEANFEVVVDIEDRVPPISIINEDSVLVGGDNGKASGKIVLGEDVDSEDEDEDDEGFTLA